MQSRRWRHGGGLGLLVVQPSMIRPVDARLACSASLALKLAQQQQQDPEGLSSQAGLLILDLHDNALDPINHSVCHEGPGHPSQRPHWQLEKAGGSVSQTGEAKAR